MALLDTYRQGTAANVESDIKTRTLAILRDYRNPWDIYAELLQNSVDSINRRYNMIQSGSSTDYGYDNEFDVEYSDDYLGKILIEVTPSKRTVRISDNGTGMPADCIEKLLLPDGTDKRVGKEYGYKGKGLCRWKRPGPGSSAPSCPSGQYAHPSVHRPLWLRFSRSSWR